MSNEIKNAIIESVTLGIDCGLLTAWLWLDYGGTSQRFGGITLHLPFGFRHHRIESVAGHFICRCMEVAGVVEWDDLEGKAIRVRIEDGLAVGIGHIVKADWFVPRVDFAELEKGKEAK